MRAGQTALLLRSGRRWRKAPDGGRPDSPSPAKREKGGTKRRMRAGQTALLLRSGRRWREAPDEGASEASCSCPSPAPDQVKSSASLRSRALIRPSGTFSRVREKGWRSEEHTSELPSLMSTSYAVFC